VETLALRSHSSSTFLQGKNDENELLETHVPCIDNSIVVASPISAVSANTALEARNDANVSSRSACAATILLPVLVCIEVQLPIPVTHWATPILVYNPQNAVRSNWHMAGALRPEFFLVERQDSRRGMRFGLPLSSKCKPV
jgi:hypothetical protein